MRMNYDHHYCQRCALSLPYGSTYCSWCAREYRRSQPKPDIQPDRALTIAELSSMVLSGRLGITRLRKAWTTW